MLYKILAKPKFYINLLHFNLEKFPFSEKYHDEKQNSKENDTGNEKHKPGSTKICNNK